MSKTYTERGFANYADFVDTYGTSVVVRQSSSATDDCVWVFTSNTDNDGSAHLNIEQAIKLISALSEWLVDVTSEEQAKDLSSEQEASKKASPEPPKKEEL